MALTLNIFGIVSRFVYPGGWQVWISSVRLLRQNVQHTAKSLWNILLKNKYYNYCKLICQFLDKYFST